jgi:hypothetical protein
MQTRRDFLKMTAGTAVVPALLTADNHAATAPVQNKAEWVLPEELETFTSDPGFVSKLEKVQEYGNSLQLKYIRGELSVPDEIKVIHSQIVDQINRIVCQNTMQILRERYRDKLHYQFREDMQERDSHDSMPVRLDYGLLDTIGWKTIVQQICDHQERLLCKIAASIWRGKYRQADGTLPRLLIYKPPQVQWNLWKDETTLSMVAGLIISKRSQSIQSTPRFDGTVNHNKT